MISDNQPNRTKVFLIEQKSVILLFVLLFGFRLTEPIIFEFLIKILILFCTYIKKEILILYCNFFIFFFFLKFQLQPNQSERMFLLITEPNQNIQFRILFCKIEN